MQDQIKTSESNNDDARSSILGVQVFRKVAGLDIYQADSEYQFSHENDIDAEMFYIGVEKVKEIIGSNKHV